MLIGFAGGLCLRKWYGALNNIFKGGNKAVCTVKKVTGKLATCQIDLQYLLTANLFL